MPTVDLCLTEKRFGMQLVDDFGGMSAIWLVGPVHLLDETGSARRDVAHLYVLLLPLGTKLFFLLCRYAYRSR